MLPNGLELSEGSLGCLPFGLGRFFFFSGGPGVVVCALTPD